MRHQTGLPKWIDRRAKKNVAKRIPFHFKDVHSVCWVHSYAENLGLDEFVTSLGTMIQWPKVLLGFHFLAMGFHSWTATIFMALASQLRIPCLDADFEAAHGINRSERTGV